VRLLYSCGRIYLWVPVAEARPLTRRFAQFIPFDFICLAIYLPLYWVFIFTTNISRTPSGDHGTVQWGVSMCFVAEGLVFFFRILSQTPPFTKRRKYGNSLVYLKFSLSPEVAWIHIPRLVFLRFWERMMQARRGSRPLQRNHDFMRTVLCIFFFKRSHWEFQFLRFSNHISFTYYFPKVLSFGCRRDLLLFFVAFVNSFFSFFFFFFFLPFWLIIFARTCPSPYLQPAWSCLFFLFPLI